MKIRVIKKVELIYTYETGKEYTFAGISFHSNYFGGYFIKTVEVPELVLSSEVEMTPELEQEIVLFNLK